MRRVGARQLKQHTGAVIERVQRGERLLLTYRRNPIAISTPIDAAAFDELLNREAEDAESLAWLKASERYVIRFLGQCRGCSVAPRRSS